MPASPLGFQRPSASEHANVHVELVFGQPANQHAHLLFRAGRSSVGMTCRMRLGKSSRKSYRHCSACDGKRSRVRTTPDEGQPCGRGEATDGNSRAASPKRTRSDGAFSRAVDRWGQSGRIALWSTGPSGRRTPDQLPGMSQAITGRPAAMASNKANDIPSSHEGGQTGRRRPATRRRCRIPGQNHVVPQAALDFRLQFFLKRPLADQPQGAVRPARGNRLPSGDQIAQPLGRMQPSGEDRQRSALRQPQRQAGRRQCVARGKLSRRRPRGRNRNPVGNKVEPGTRILCMKQLLLDRSAGHDHGIGRHAATADSPATAGVLLPVVVAGRSGPFRPEHHGQVAAHGRQGGVGVVFSIDT